MSQDCPPLPFLFNIAPEILAIAIGKRKYIKDIKIVKKNIKYSLFLDDIILYLENHKESSKILEIYLCSIVAVYKIMCKNSLLFYIQTMK